MPGGLWIRCEDCGETIFRKEAEELMNVCPQCGYHMYLSAPLRVRSVLDEGTFEEWDSDLSPTDPLTFISVAVLFLIIAFMASWLPALRAAGLDPTTALRNE